ncbi:unnamed protein product [Parnassius apollo]|uniref:(apollo) hypothetical protein n=1 Tax=Parnassius apollo TaxID=110799 RepID=A0A8S3WGZ9_PARAO|nr:unnamed protein product [Parnassius apollo]
MKCSACGKFMAAVEGFTCPKCDKKSHRACVKVPEGVQVQTTWLCPDCKIRTPRKSDQNTPVRGLNSENIIKQGEEKPQSPVAQGFKESELALELRKFREELRETREEFRSFRQEMFDLRNSTKSCEERLDTLENKYIRLEEQQTLIESKNVCGKIQDLETIIADLRADLNDRDQELLYNDIEVAGIPEEGAENVLHIVTACATKLGVTLEERDIVNCVRVGLMRDEQSRLAKPP